MSVSIVEYWSGSAWVQANTNAGSSATIRVDIVDKLGNPRVANITVMNPSAKPFGSGSDRYGPLTAIFSDFTPVRIIETDSKVVLFAGKVYSSRQEYDKAFGQVIKVYARDNLAELADMPTDDKTKLIVSDSTTNLKSEVIQKIIHDSASDPHSSSLMISTSNIATDDTDKFEASERALTSPFPAFDVASMGKQGLKVISEIAHNDAHDASGPAKDFGYDYYVDTQYTLASDSNPAADLNYFKRGTRTKFEGTAANFDGLTVEYPVVDFTRTGIKVFMLPEYDFNNPPSDLYTGAIVALTSDIKDADDATVTHNTSLEFEILEGTPSAAFIHADPTISTSAWEGKLFARVGNTSTDAKKFADYLWKFGVDTDTTANLNGAIDNDSSTTTLTIEETGTAGDAAFKAGQIILIDTESMYVTAVNSNTEIEVIRAWGGSGSVYSGVSNHSDDATIKRHKIVGRIQYQSTNSNEAGYIIISFERDTVSSTTLNTQKKEFEAIAVGSSPITLTNGNQTFVFTPSTGRPKVNYGINRPLRIVGNDIKSIDATRDRIASGLSRTKSSRTECIVNTLPPPFTYIETGELDASATASSATQVTLVAPADRTAYDIGLRVGMTIAKVDSTGTQTAYGYVTAIADTSSTTATITAPLNTGDWEDYTSSDGTSNKLRFYIPVRAGHYIRANNILVNFEGYMLTQEITYTEQAGVQVTMYKGTGVNSAGLPIGLGIDPNAIVAAIEGEVRKYPRITNVPMGGLGWTFRPTDTTNTATFTGTNQTTMTWTGGKFTIGQINDYTVRAGNSGTLVTTVDSNTTYPKVYKVLFDPDQAPDDNGTFTFTFTLEEDYKPDMDHVIMGHARAGSAATVNAMIIFDGSGTGLFGSRDAVGENAFSAALFKKSLQPYTTDIALFPGKHTSTSSSAATPDNLQRYLHATSGVKGTGVNGTISFADNTTVTLNYNNGSTTTDARPTLDLGTVDNTVYYIFFMLADSGDDETSDMTAVTQAIVDRTTTYSHATSDSRGLLAICSTGDVSELDEIAIQAFHGKGQNITADVIAANAITALAIKTGSLDTHVITITGNGRIVTTSGMDRAGTDQWTTGSGGVLIDNLGILGTSAADTDISSTEFYLSAADGKAYFGGGAIKATADGLIIGDSDALTENSSIKWTSPATENPAFIQRYQSASGSYPQGTLLISAQNDLVLSGTHVMPGAGTTYLGHTADLVSGAANHYMAWNYITAKTVNFMNTSGSYSEFAAISAPANYSSSNSTTPRYTIILPTDIASADDQVLSVASRSSTNLTMEWSSSSGTVTSVATSGAITGGTITTTGTITHLTSAGYKHVPTSGSSGQFLQYSSSGTAVWATNYTVGSTTSSGSVPTSEYGVFRYPTDGGGGSADTLAFLSGQGSAVPASGTAESAFWTMLSESDGGSGSRLLFEPIVDNSSGKNNAWIGWHNPLYGIQSYYINAGNGNEAYPSHTFMGDTDTGMYASAGNVLCFSTGGADRMKISSTGFFPADDDAYSLGYSIKGFTEVFATNGTINTSDRRAKIAIVPTRLGLDFINLLKPISYKWKNKPEQPTHYGLIAQEVLETLKEVGLESRDDFGGITGDEDTTYGAGYSEFVAILIKAVQELSEKVKKLEEEK